MVTPTGDKPNLDAIVRASGDETLSFFDARLQHFIPQSLSNKIQWWGRSATWEVLRGATDLSGRLMQMHFKFKHLDCEFWWLSGLLSVAFGCFQKKPQGHTGNLKLRIYVAEFLKFAMAPCLGTFVASELQLPEGFKEIQLFWDPNHCCAKWWTLPLACGARGTGQTKSWSRWSFLDALRVPRFIWFILFLHYLIYLPNLHWPAKLPGHASSMLDKRPQFPAPAECRQKHTLRQVHLGLPNYFDGHLVWESRYLWAAPWDFCHMCPADGVARKRCIQCWILATRTARWCGRLRQVASTKRSDMSSAKRFT